MQRPDTMTSSSIPSCERNHRRAYPMPKREKASGASDRYASQEEGPSVALTTSGVETVRWRDRSCRRVSQDVPSARWMAAIMSRTVPGTATRTTVAGDATGTHWQGWSGERRGVSRHRDTSSWRVQATLWQAPRGRCWSTVWCSSTRSVSVPTLATGAGGLSAGMQGAVIVTSSRPTIWTVAETTTIHPTSCLHAWRATRVGLGASLQRWAPTSVEYSVMRADRQPVGTP